MKFLNDDAKVEFASKKVEQGVEFRYQAIGKAMQKDFKQNIWWLFYRYNEDDIIYAYEQCKKYKKFHVPYLISIIKNRYEPASRNAKGGGRT